MEQLRLIGEAMGSLRTLMIFREEIQINKKQCCLLFDVFNLSFDSISQEIKQHLRFDEQQTKWHALENPLKELQRVIQEGEYYIKQCIEPKEWWAKAIALSLNTDCVEFHLHNLLWCFFLVLETIENVGEISSRDQESINRKRVLLSKKYDREWMDPKLFFHHFAKQYLVSKDMCRAFSSAGREDRWILTEQISEKKASMSLTKHESHIAELLLAPRDKAHPSSVLVGSKDYQVRRRLGAGSQYKEVQWMGESFALRHCFSGFESMSSEISLRTSITHPNVLSYMYTFSDDEKKECFVLMELMSKDLSKYIKETSSSKRRVPFTLLVAVDIMIQIARGMEHLHSKKVYHGDLNPSNILAKPRYYSTDGFLHVKITGFGQSSIKNSNKSAQSPRQTQKQPCIWYAPEVLAEQDLYTEKADVYSFAMICFELLTGKIPFEDDHLQGDKMSRNIRAGERPLFSNSSPKYLTNLTKKCWHADPSQRPSFSSICRILRYMKRFIIISRSEMPSPLVDYFDIEMSLLKKYKSWETTEGSKVSEIPFQMFCYRVLERERSTINLMERSSDSGSDETSAYGDDYGMQMMTREENFGIRTMPRSQSHPEIHKKKSGLAGMKTSNSTAQQLKGRTRRLPQLLIRGQNARMISESPFHSIITSPLRMTASSSSRRSSGLASDSELT